MTKRFKVPNYSPPPEQYKRVGLRTNRQLTKEKKTAILRKIETNHALKLRAMFRED